MRKNAGLYQAVAADKKQSNVGFVLNMESWVLSGEIVRGAQMKKNNQDQVLGFKLEQSGLKIYQTEEHFLL